MIMLERAIATKQVGYFGITLEIPASHNFIATGRSGDVWSFINKPYADTFTWDTGHDRDTGFQCLGKVDLEDMDWQDTLREV